MYLPLHAFAQADLRVGYVERGTASYYGEKHNKKKTASGEVFNMYDFTCSHPEIPFGSKVRITNIDNGQWVVLRVTDRGPLTHKRISDVSKAAALKLNMVRTGTANIELELIQVADPSTSITYTASADTTSAATKAIIAKAEPAKKTPSKQQTATQQPAKPANKAVVKAQPKQQPSQPVKQQPARMAAVPKPFGPVNTYFPNGRSAAVQGYAAQIAVFDNIDQALEEARKADQRGLDNITIQSGYTNSLPMYRVMYGAVSTAEAARLLVTEAKENGFQGAFVRPHFKKK